MYSVQLEYIRAEASVASNDLLYSVGEGRHSGPRSDGVVETRVHTYVRYIYSVPNSQTWG